MITGKNQQELIPQSYPEGKKKKRKGKVDFFFKCTLSRGKTMPHNILLIKYYSWSQYLPKKQQNMCASFQTKTLEAQNKV